MFEDLNWIVVPGGPGLSATYVKQGFVGAFTGYKLHYYDPLGAPETKIDHVPTIGELINQIFAVAEMKKFKQFGLITHSFGSYLAMRILEQIKHNVVALIMISSTPFVDIYWKMAFQKISANIPDHVLKKIQELAIDVNNGPEIFDLFFPYYAVKTVKTLPRIPFDTQMCDQISKQVGDYDDTGLLSACNIPWACIMGEHDPFYFEKDLLLERTILIPGVGHYPFYEDPAAFTEATKNIENKLRQKRKTIEKS
jgi:pimeloyl-ACP methyl ester carboxylesterase